MRFRSKKAKKSIKQLEQFLRDHPTTTVTDIQRVSCADGTFEYREKPRASAALPIELRQHTRHWNPQPPLKRKTNLRTARRAAEEAGEATYYGKSCGKGHNGWRRTSTGNCIQCVRDADTARREKRGVPKRAK